jgi:replication-associated recombination protein RarA
MNGNIFHPDTKKQIRNFINSPGHALLLSGPNGSGKSTLAAGLAETVTGIAPNSLDNYAYKMIISTTGNSIGIEEVRKLVHFLSLRVPSAAKFNRAVIIEDAQLLTLEAQNAILKTLEEPPAGTFIILTASHTQTLLPTIRSRSQLITIRKPSKSNLLVYFEKMGYTPTDINQAYSISGGLPGLMHALLTQDDHQLLKATEEARRFLKATIYERLIMVDELSKDRELCLNMAYILQQMAHVSLQTACGRVAKRWYNILSSAFTAVNSINQNAQLKLTLINLALAF